MSKDRGSFPYGRQARPVQPVVLRSGIPLHTPLLHSAKTPQHSRNLVHAAEARKVPPRALLGDSAISGKASPARVFGDRPERSATGRGGFVSLACVRPGSIYSPPLLGGSPPLPPREDTSDWGGSAELERAYLSTLC